VTKAVIADFITYLLGVIQVTVMSRDMFGKSGEKTLGGLLASEYLGFPSQWKYRIKYRLLGLRRYYLEDLVLHLPTHDSVRPDDVFLLSGHEFVGNDPVLVAGFQVLNLS
jgi:hypothetical protein